MPGKEHEKSASTQKNTDNDLAMSTHKTVARKMQNLMTKLHRFWFWTLCPLFVYISQTVETNTLVINTSLTISE